MKIQTFFYKNLHADKVYKSNAQFFEQLKSFQYSKVFLCVRESPTLCQEKTKIE